MAVTSVSMSSSILTLGDPERAQPHDFVDKRYG
jgi:hypothetical protein